MFKVENLSLQDSKLFTLRHLKDNRGWFVETYRKSWIEDNIDQKMNFVFDYTSFNLLPNTVRGMHAQTHLYPQSKLVTVLHGSIQDVIVDARKDSPTFGQSCSVILTDKSPQVLYVPIGFYHGFITLEANTLVSYKLDNYHNAECECGFLFDDDQMNIDWSIQDQSMITISERDKKHPSWESAYKF